jgi:hypothetical protein
MKKLNKTLDFIALTSTIFLIMLNTYQHDWPLVLAWSSCLIWIIIAQTNKK